MASARGDVLAGVLRTIQALAAQTAAIARADVLPFKAGGVTVGCVLRELAEKKLSAFPAALTVEEDCVRVAEAVDGSVEERTAALADVLSSLREEGQFSGWRDERYAVVPRWGAAAVLEMERAAATTFGIGQFGVHVNGFVRGEDGELKMWVAKRSASKATHPGKLDNMVAGGQPAGISAWDNVVKECAEEASLPEELARQAQAVGMIRWHRLQHCGVKQSCMFVYDLCLPADVVPTPCDGEVDAFTLMGEEQLLAALAAEQFKPSIAVVVVDWMMRHAMLKADEDAAVYTELADTLTRCSGLCT